ncbi:MAG: hypothetical protein ACTSYF_00285 [Promethearchaeota archaeon]
MNDMCTCIKHSIHTSLRNVDTRSKTDGSTFETSRLSKLYFLLPVTITSLF